MYIENDPTLLKMDKNNTLCTYTKSLKVRTLKCSQGWVTSRLLKY